MVSTGVPGLHIHAQVSLRQVLTGPFVCGGTRTSSLLGVCGLNPSSGLLESGFLGSLLSLQWTGGMTSSGGFTAVVFHLSPWKAAMCPQVSCPHSLSNQRGSCPALASRLLHHLVFLSSKKQAKDNCFLTVHISFSEGRMDRMDRGMEGHKHRRTNGRRKDERTDGGMEERTDVTLGWLLDDCVLPDQISTCPVLLRVSSLKMSTLLDVMMNC